MGHCDLHTTTQLCVISVSRNNHVTSSILAVLLNGQARWLSGLALLESWLWEGFSVWQLHVCGLHILPMFVCVSGCSSFPPFDRGNRSWFPGVHSGCLRFGCFKCRKQISLRGSIKDNLVLAYCQAALTFWFTLQMLYLQTISAVGLNHELYVKRFKWGSEYFLEHTKWQHKFLPERLQLQLFRWCFYGNNKQTWYYPD